MNKENISKKFEENQVALLWDNLFFGIIYRHPPEDLQKFLKIYLPTLCAKQAEGGRVIYPDIKQPRTYRAKLIYEFVEHPYFKGNYFGGELIFHCDLAEEQVDVYSIRHFDLCLLYKNRENAAYDFEKLRLLLGEVYNEKKSVETEDQKFILLAQKNAEYHEMELALAYKEFFSGIYKIDFKFVIGN